MSAPALGPFTIEVRYRLGEEVRSAAGSDGCLQLSGGLNGDRLTLTVTPREEVTLLSAVLRRPFPYGEEDMIFANGYQSWTDSHLLRAKPPDRQKNVMALPGPLVRKFSFDRYGDAYFKPYRKGVIHGYDVSYVTGAHNLFVVSQNRRNAFLIINHHTKSGVLELESDVAGLRLTGAFPLFDLRMAEEDFASHLDPLLGEKKPLRRLLGYTSWYNHYQNIDEGKLRRALDGLDPSFDLFQIDDGFETAVGDWLSVDPAKFPKGLRPMVEDIHKKGLLAGIWLAPFAGERVSQVVRDHPDWFLRDGAGAHISCGCNWSGFYGLNFYHPEAREYVRTCLTHYLDLGFDFFKLDFLYAVSAATPPDKTRAQVSWEAYSFLREVLGDKLILGSGAAFSTAFGLFDYMRVGPDVSLIFDDVWYMKFMHRERISTKVTVQNTVYRSFFNGRVFGCDPDVFLLRDDNLKLSPAQRRALLLLNALFGSLMMTSDDLAAYSPEKRALLEDALALSREGEVLSFRREGKDIAIEARRGDRALHLTYHTDKGELEGYG